MKKPILFLIFNRPDTTKKVFEAIREYQPKELYIAADGPRQDKDGEKELCEETRKITENIDWDCEVKTLFREENLGCRDAVSSAITWFFENVGDGIILEDDCLPNQSFFRFCEELLDRYKYDNRIMHINGNNYSAKKNYFSKSNYSYHFGRMPQVWGWATWKRSWDNFKKDIDINNLEKNNYFDYFFQDKKLKNNQINRWIEVTKNKIDTWDFQWHFAVISNYGLTIIPKKNLISNIGFNENATHTIDKNSTKGNLDIKNMNFPLKHPKFIIPDIKIDKWYQKKMLGFNNIIIDKIKKMYNIMKNKDIKSYIKRIIGKKITKINYPIIINSYGRSGSTVLTESITKGSIKIENYFINKIISKFINYNAWDLNNSYIQRGFIYKTHDYPSNNLPKNTKVIYVFSNPKDVVLSLLRLHREYGEEWMIEHYKHLKSKYTDISKITKEDQINMERHIKSWLNFNNVSIAFVRYEKMWQNQEKISDFLGFKIKLPLYKKRKSLEKNKEKTLKEINKNYNNLIKKINKLDDFFIIK